MDFNKINEHLERQQKKAKKIKERRHFPPLGSAHRDKKNDYRRKDFKDPSNWP